MVNTEIEIQDADLREEALNIGRSFIVQAPAGSGKTGLLTLRYLRLLASVEKEPEECLALTFTRKAAREMRERILCALKSALNETPPRDPYELTFWQYASAVLKRDKAKGWNLLIYPERLKIQTIDAFCAELVRQMPLLSGLGTEFVIAENAYPFYVQAARGLLKQLEYKTPLQNSLICLLKHLDNNLTLIERLLADMLANREQWLPYVMSTRPETQSRHLLENSLQVIILEALQHLMQHLPNHFQEILDLAEFAAHHAPSGASIATFRDLSLGLRPTLEDLPKWLALSTLFLTQNATLRKTVTAAQGFPAPTKAHSKEDKAYYKLMKTRMENVLADLEQQPLFVEALIALRTCPAPYYDEEQWELVQALLKLLPDAVSELMLVFQHENQMDFTEILLAADRALGNIDDPSELTLKLDYKIRHILVDEFQDTSIPQWRLLEKLTAGWQPGDGRTLFLVGDPMQSIYRFRQAEVGLFIKAKTGGLGDIVLDPLILRSNFRSDKILVEWVNQHFCDRFPKEEDMTVGAITFNASIANRECHDADSAIVSKIVSDYQEEAEYIAAAIEEVKSKNNAGSIALLVRSRAHLKFILTVLKEKNIAYQGVQLSLLTERTIVQDLMSLTRALLHFEDRIAWLAILRAPWAKCALADLLLIAQYNMDMPIWWTLERYTEISALSLDAKQTLARMVSVLEEVLAEVGRLSLRDAVMQAWQGFGCASSLQDETSIKDAETYLAFLENLPENASYRVGEWEERLKSLYAKEEVQDPSILQIMTIHKAKGLEFDTVIVAGIGRKLRSDTEKLLLWEERTSQYAAGQLILAPIKSIAADTDPIYHYLKQQVKKRASFEAERLLYVAATRAKKRLYWISHEAYA